MPYQQQIELALSANIGSSGISQDRFDARLQQIPSVVEAIKQQYIAEEIGFITAAEATDDLADIAQQASYIRNNFANCVVVGTGGSSLGGIALTSLRRSIFPTAATNIYFMENSDPHSLQQLFNELSFSDSLFIIISKSGTTVEVMAQFMLILQRIKQLNLSPAKHFVVITTCNNNPLHKLAIYYDIPVIAHAANIGGRFSVMSVVGLLPAAVIGVDIAALRAGAAEITANCWQKVAKSAPAIGASLQIAAIDCGKNISVFMPYCDRLDNMGRWYQQLWAESVGKDNKGSTAIRALGAVDQHSQLQLYLAGPKDKLITIISPDYATAVARDNGYHSATGTISDTVAKQANMEFLAGHCASDIIMAQQIATKNSLANHSIATRYFTLSDIDDYNMGALFQHFMLETVFAAGLLNVNAFNQPAVEEGKQLARKLLADMQ